MKICLNFIFILMTLMIFINESISQTDWSLKFSSHYLKIPTSLSFENLDGLSYTLWVNRYNGIQAGCCNGYLIDFSDATCAACYPDNRYLLTQHWNNWDFTYEGANCSSWSISSPAQGMGSQWVFLVVTLDAAAQKENSM
ncbi:MAG: hypothetical protein IPJ06_00290 [Saprospiraceae bacterium]|nr:hypothetical protein [Saprospiraceae bacterium]